MRETIRPERSTHLETAARLVREAGEMAKARIREVEVCTMKGRDDLVTDTDLRVEAHILDALTAAFPGHGYISEEAGTHRPDAEHVWILDPLDGTKHYARGNPLYSVSLGLWHRGVSVLGVVYLPACDQFYLAEHGAGATHNDRPIRVSAVEKLEDAVVCLELPSRNATKAARARAMRQMGVLVERCQRVRIVGVASVGLCLTAAASFDAYLNLGSNWEDYDVAAAEVILREAGGTYRADRPYIVAGPESLCRALDALIAGSAGSTSGLER